MRKIALIICITFAFTVLLAGCVKQYKEKEAALEQPVNCAHAEGDIRTLEHEKTHTKEQIRAGVQSIVPISLVGGLVTGTTKTKARIATGKYNDMIDEKIAKIKSTCGID